MVTSFREFPENRPKAIWAPCKLGGPVLIYHPTNHGRIQFLNEGLKHQNDHTEHYTPRHYTLTVPGICKLSSNQVLGTWPRPGTPDGSKSWQTGKDIVLPTRCVHMVLATPFTYCWLREGWRSFNTNTRNDGCQWFPFWGLLEADWLEVRVPNMPGMPIPVYRWKELTNHGGTGFPTDRV